MANSDSADAAGVSSTQTVNIPGRELPPFSTVDTRHVTGYTQKHSFWRLFAPVIRKISHKGLKKLYEEDSAAKVNPDHADKLRRILARLDAASKPQDMDLPGYGLHKLKGKLKGFWSVEVSGNWRVIFRFEAGHAVDVDFVDYH